MAFQLDPFQVQAIEWIEKEHSLLVSAPTGSGKTLIAERAVEKDVNMVCDSSFLAESRLGAGRRRRAGGFLKRPADGIQILPHGERLLERGEAGELR